VVGKEANDLAANLEVGHVGVEVEAVEAVEVEQDMAVEDVVDVRELGHLLPPGRGQPRPRR
jgi:hypothetical protein